MFGARRIALYPASIQGTFQTIHRASGAALLAVLLLTPWIRISGVPLLQADLSARQFFLAGMVFTPRDSILLFLMLASAALALGLFTALWGRLWCGFTCPQTVMLEELVRRIETAIEGEAGTRRKRDRGPWTLDRSWRKAAKWGAFAAIAVFIAVHFMGFFADIHAIVGGTARQSTYVATAAFSVIMFLDFAWFREQFCNYLCPYARLQGVLTDRDSVVISYISTRGEPRLDKKAIRAGTPRDSFGDCVDCNRCVHVCPTGIDIRDGFQLECISCARCIDACEDVMGRQGLPNLITFASEAELEGKPRRHVRPRTLVYGALLTVIGVAATVFLVTRADFDATVMPSREVTSATVMPDGRIQNLYQVALFNNTMNARSFTVSLEGVDGAEVIVPGGRITVEPAGRIATPVFVLAPPESLAGRITPVTFLFQDGDATIRRPTTFRVLPENRHASLGPVRSGAPVAVRDGERHHDHPRGEAPRHGRGEL